jgi:natural product biosynthesis luciferase-like monooxygenase protein
MFENVEVVRRLWAGELVKFKGVNDEEMSVRILPVPLQPELPIWITSSSSVETWLKAGEIGANILSGLSGIGDRPVEDIAKKIDLYRQSLAAHGHPPHSRRVALMLHTYVERDMQSIREKVKGPLSSYLRTFIAQGEYLTTSNARLGVGKIKERDREALIAFSVDRFISTSSLIGTPEKCVEMLARLEAIGVDEVACFIDFGLDARCVLEGLSFLDESILKFSSQSKTV